MAVRRPYEVWKFELPTRGEVLLSMPANATTLTVQLQDDRPVLWALVAPMNAEVTRLISVVPTGVALPEGGTYVGTFQVKVSRRVWVGHVFDFGYRTEVHK